MNNKIVKAIKWLMAITAFALIVAIFAGLSLGWFKTKDEPTMSETAVEGSGGLELSDATETGGISLMSAVIPRSEYAAQAIAASAQKAYTLTATITPADADNQSVDWAVAFVNPSSSWASGKTVTDYVTITPQADGSLTATAQCLKAFGEKIKITVTSRENTDAKAECTADYVKRLTTVNVKMGTTTGGLSVNGVSALKLVNSSEAEESIVLTPTYSDFTKDATYRLSYSSFEFASDVKQKLITSLQGGAGAVTTDWFQSWDSPDKALTLESIVENCLKDLNGNKAAKVYYIKSELSKYIREAGSSYTLGSFRVQYLSSDGGEMFDKSTTVYATSDAVKTYVDSLTLKESNLLF